MYARLINHRLYAVITESLLKKSLFQPGRRTTKEFSARNAGREQTTALWNRESVTRNPLASSLNEHLWTKCTRNDGRKRCPPVINSTLDFPDPIPLWTQSRACVRTHVARNTRFSPSQRPSISFYLKRPIFHATVPPPFLERLESGGTFSNAPRARSVNLSNEPSLGWWTRPKTGKDRLPWARQFTAAIIASYRELYKKRLHATLERGNWPSAVYHRHPVRYTSCTSRLQGLRFDQKELESPRSVLRCYTAAKNVDWVASRDVLILPRSSRWKFLKGKRFSIFVVEN